MKTLNKPLLIDEALCRRLNPIDRRDYINAVKEYNRSGDKYFLKVARYFENGKRNLNGINQELLSQAQVVLETITLSRTQIAKRIGMPATFIGDVQNGYCVQLDNARVRQALRELKKLKKASILST